MQGKILKVFNNDINSKEDDREIQLFAIFNHKKYSNKYAIFTINNTNKLCYGSIFIRDNTIVIFNIKEDFNPLISDFINEYKNNSFKEYELLSTEEISKVELVNYNEIDYPDINSLYTLSFPKPTPPEENKNNKSSLKIVLITIFFIILTIIVYFFVVNNNKPKTLDCTINSHNYDINLDYIISKNITFNERNLIEKIEVTETYKFPSLDEYDKFKKEEKHYDYFGMKGSYKYIDEEQILKIFYNEATLASDYDQIKSILSKEGYTCIEEQNE